MKAIELLKKAQYKYFQTISFEVKRSIKFEQYWEDWIEGLIELDIDYNRISGTNSLIGSNSTSIKDAIKMKVESDGHWLWLYIGHSGEFSLSNFKNKNDAEELIVELSGNEYVTSMFIC